MLFFCGITHISTPTNTTTSSDPLCYIISAKQNLSSFNFIRRYFAKEMLLMGVRVASLKATSRNPTEINIENMENVKCFVLRDGKLSAVIVVSKEYSTDVAVKIIRAMLVEGKRRFGRHELKQNIEKDLAESFPYLEVNFEMFGKGEFPETKNKLDKMNEDVENLKGSVSDIIEKVVVRGDNLNELVAKSDQLSSAAKQFYKTAHAKNAGCCDFS